MDNVTHTLVGVALSHTGLNRKTRFATLALVAGGNLPDIDIIARLGGSVTYLAYHRGITHSILGVIIFALVLYGIICFLGRKSPAKNSGVPLNRRWLLATCLIATGSHLLLDFTNAYGVRLFLPFSRRWFGWDIMFIFDPVLLCLLIAGLGLPALLRLVSEEVGARKRSLRGGAIFCLAATVVLWGVRDFSHRRALSLLNSHTYREENPQRVGAFPSPANPFEWVGVVETDSAFHILEVDATAADIDPETSRIYRKADPSAALDAAMKTRAARVFSRFARFLWPQVNETEDDFDVTLWDLRFASLPSSRGPVAEIALDKNFRVLSESFSFTGRTSGP